MTLSRARWLEAAQIARADGGPEALAVLRSLPPQEQREVHAFGEKLAGRSLAAAQSYALKAPHARRTLDARSFSEWVRLGLGLAGESFEGRDSLAAFFRLDPVALMRVDPHVRRRWVELCGELQKISRRLAAACIESSGRSLPRLGAEAVVRLEAWVEAGTRLGGSAGWRGEFLAAAYFGSGEKVLAHLAPAEIRAWAELGASIQVGREISQAYFHGLPARFRELDARDRRLLLAIGRSAAASAPRTAARLFAELPAVTASLDREVRHPLLEAIRHAADPEEMTKLLPLLGAIVRSVPERQRTAVLARIGATAERFPTVLPSLLRSLPRLFGETDAAGVIHWIGRGEALSAENPEAGMAYFRLESRTSVQALRDTSAAARFEEAQGVLRSYARMLSGQALRLRAAEGPSLRPFLDLESLDRASFALPERVDVFDSWEENFSLLKLMTANGVARLLFGTYDLHLPRVWERLPAPIGAALSAAIGGDRLAHLLEAVPEADPLIPLFAAAEGARVDARLRRVYRGYDAEIRACAGRLRRRTGGRRLAAELVLFLLGAGESPRSLSSRELPARVLETTASV
ncbi:MAG: hypothetical protein ACREQ9_27340, partial [Candidatus Binatia bacterium]